MNIVVTGASRGIGLAILKKFAKKGFNVAFCSRDPQKVQQAEEAIREVAPGVEVLATTADLSLKEEVVKFAAFIKSKWKDISVLVNNAGTFVPGDLLKEVDGTLEKTVETNLYSAYYLTRLLHPVINRSGKGYIFNMCSVASLKAYSAGGSYGISKYALDGFSKNLREELKPEKIRVSSIFPGATYTDSWKGNTDLPPERFMKPEDVADVVYTTYALSENTVVEDIILRPMEGDI